MTLLHSARYGRLNARLIDCEHERLASNAIHAHHGAGRGFYKRAVRWMRHAEISGYDAVVLLVDEDGRHERRDEINAAQEEQRVTRVSRALGVAIRTFDAWMLADEQALTRALNHPVSRQPEPESIIHPQEVCRQLLEVCSSKSSQAEMYTVVALSADLSVLSERCRLGFAPFAERVQAL